jgi:hypothetical protein
MNAWSILADAIKNRVPVSFTYRGAQKVACPHKLGYDKSGSAKVLVCQTGGDSHSGGRGSDDDWRCLFVDLMRNVAIVEGAFQTPGNYSAAVPSCMASVALEVAGGRIPLSGSRKPKAKRRGRQKRPIRRTRK